MTRAFITLVLITFPAWARADDWPQFLGPRRDGISQEKNIRTTWPADGPARVWKLDVGAGYGSPVVAGERLILFHRVGDQEVVECLEPATGKSLWKTGYPCDYVDNFGKGNGPRSTPTIVGNHVVTFGADGTLACFTLGTGEKRWARPLLKDYKVPPGYFGVATSPVVFENRVLVNVGGKEAGIVAFALEDGKELWRATRDAASYSSPIITTLEGQPRALFFTREGAVMLDPRDGKVLFQKRWRARYDASVNAAVPLLLPGNQAFFSTSYETGDLLLKLKKDEADVVWTDEEAMANHYNTCVFHDGYLYGCHGRQEAGAHLRCLDPNGPKVMWTKDRFGCATIIGIGSKLLMLTEKGELVVAEANPKVYRELSRAKVLTDAPIRAQPALSNGRLFARDQSTLIALDLRAE